MISGQVPVLKGRFYGSVNLEETVGMFVGIDFIQKIESAFTGKR